MSTGNDDAEAKKEERANALNELLRGASMLQSKQASPHADDAAMPMPMPRRHASPALMPMPDVDEETRSEEVGGCQQ